jgi:hypothetical protein
VGGAVIVGGWLPGGEDLDQQVVAAQREGGVTGGDARCGAVEWCTAITDSGEVAVLAAAASTAAASSVRAGSQRVASA